MQITKKINSVIMCPFSNKELYIMNGGQKHYILKDGFADVYDATPAEEAEWTKEIIENALSKIAMEEDTISLETAIANLVFHKYENLDALLVHSIRSSSPAKQLVLAVALWNMRCSENDFQTIFKILLQYKGSCITDLIQRPADFKNHLGARYFLVSCLEGNDEYLFEKVHTILSVWAWSGLSQLRENGALDKLQFHIRKSPQSKHAIQRLKEILTFEI